MQGITATPPTSSEEYAALSAEYQQYKAIANTEREQLLRELAEARDKPAVTQPVADESGMIELKAKLDALKVCIKYL